METAEALAVVIRGLRREQRLSQEEMSSIGRAHLSRIERGEGNITLDVLVRLSRIFELDPAALLLMAASVQHQESFSEGLKRLSKQFKQIEKSSLDLEIQSLVQAGKLPPGRPARADAEHKAAEAKRMSDAGATAAIISDALGISVTTVRRYLKAPTDA